METLRAIFTRRSIRKYSGGFVSNEQLEVLLRAGMHAPSARNKQPWHFVVITDKDTLYKLGGTHPYGKMLMDAGAAIVTCGDKTIEEMDSYLLQNCSAATQNMLLAAHDLGLGAVWLGLHPREERLAAVKEILGLPDHILPVSMISIGAPDESKERDERYLLDRIHVDRW